LIPIPRRINIKTDGIFVFLEMILKKKLRIIIPANAMMSKYVFICELIDATKY
jgi:hypothetical protein